MQISTLVSNTTQAAGEVASGDRTTAHVLGVSVVGQSITQIIMWMIELNHISPPDDKTQIAIGVLASCVVSWIAQKLG